MDAKGQLTHHEYGVLKRLERVVYSGHVAPRALPSMDSVTYTYRGEGELERCDEAKATASGQVVEVTRHFYDSLERRQRTERYDGYVTTFEYDTKGNRTLVRDGTLVETRYTYDSNDRLKTATTPMGTATYEYLTDGLLWTTTYSAPTTLVERRDYDASGRLAALETTQGATRLRRFGYTYDANGNRVQQDETAGGLVERTEYGYDTADRLIGMHEPGQTVLYELDARARRTAQPAGVTGGKPDRREAGVTRGGDGTDGGGVRGAESSAGEWCPRAAAQRGGLGGVRRRREGGDVDAA